MSGAFPRPCPVCGGSGREAVHRQAFLDGPLGSGYEVVVCTNCGAGFADGIPEQAEMDRYYAEESKYAYGHAGGNESPWDMRRFEATVREVAPSLHSPQARILDIGCATGGLLSAFKRSGYPNVMGVDPSPACAEAADRLHGVRVRTATIAHLDGWAERFDLVLMVGVLEHLRDVAAAVQTAASLLKPGGRIYCAVPDVEGLDQTPGPPYQQFSFEHVNFFSVKSMSRLMAAWGLEAVATSRWSIEWRKGVTESIASGLFERGSVGAGVVDDATGAALRRYVRVSEEGDRPIRAVIDALRISREPVLVWGAGTLARRLLATSPMAEANIVVFVDSNAHLRGASLAGRPILGPDQLAGMGQRILVCSLTFQDEILGAIREHLGPGARVITLPGKNSREAATR